jgi:large subunit ribosomal protein L30e
MDLTDLIKTKIQQDKVVIGYNRVIKLLKIESPEVIVIANNFPEEKKKTIEHNTKISKIELKEYSGDGINLGLLCGKPFPVGVLAIKRSK